MEKSKGHIMFLNGYEYFKGLDGTLHKAKARNYIGVDGYRIGSRFEATASSADHHINYLKDITLNLKRQIKFAFDRIAGHTYQYISNLEIDLDIHLIVFTADDIPFTASLTKTGKLKRHSIRIRRD